MKIRLFAAIATLLAVAACGGGDQGSSGEGGSERAQALQGGSSSEGAAESVDPCGLLTAADLSPFFGDQTPIPEARVHIFESQLCEWESDAGELSLIIWPGEMYYDESDECPGCPAVEIGKEAFIQSEHLGVRIQVLLDGQVLQLEASYLDNADEEFIALARAATDRLSRD
jgi:hypothetical protein